MCDFGYIGKIALEVRLVSLIEQDAIMDAWIMDIFQDVLK